MLLAELGRLGRLTTGVERRSKMPNIVLHLVLLVLGAAIGGFVCRKDAIGIGIGIAIGASLSFTIGLREPWYLLGLLAFGPLLLWRRRKVLAA
jgi:hypothetical protein